MKDKNCSDEFERWKELGWFFAPSYEDFKWYISTGSCGEVSYNIPISFCPFCGRKLEIIKR